MSDIPIKSPRLRTWVGGALAGLSLAGIVFVFIYSTFARAQDFETVQVKVDNHESRITKVESQGERLEEDYHFQRAQLWEIAKAVGAPQMPAPAHADGGVK